MVEAAVRARDVLLEAPQLEGLRAAALLNRDDTREVYPGLALAEAVADNHGGRLVTKATAEGLILGLRLPI